MSEPSAADLVVEARPIKTARIANASAAVALLVFVIVALLMKRDNAGAYFGQTDQIFTVVIGLVVAGGLRLPAHPRLRADKTGVRTRGYVGDWRTIPWDAVVAVEFPKSVRFARVRLPAEETLAIYAVQRMDGPVAVETMRGLRALFAAVRPDLAAPTQHALPGDAEPGEAQPDELQPDELQPHELQPDETGPEAR